MHPRFIAVADLGAEVLVDLTKSRSPQFRHRPPGCRCRKLTLPWRCSRKITRKVGSVKTSSRQTRCAVHRDPFPATGAKLQTTRHDNGRFAFPGYGAMSVLSKKECQGRRAVWTRPVRTSHSKSAWIDECEGWPIPNGCRAPVPPASRREHRTAISSVARMSADMFNV